MGIELLFFGNRPQLFKTRFNHALLPGQNIQATRSVVDNKEEKESCLFEWNLAVKEMSQLFVKTAYQAEFDTTGSPFISTNSNDYSFNLDSAITNKAGWLTDMFGIDKTGLLMAERLFIRLKSGRHLSGPAKVMINHTLLPPEEITIIWDAKKLYFSDQYERLLRALEIDIPRQDTTAFEYETLCCPDQR